MNGICNLKSGETVVALRFNVYGCGAFERMIFAKPESLNDHHVMSTTLLYGGLYGEAMKNGAPAPEYSEAGELYDAISEQDDFNAQMLAMWNVYEESKWGKQFTENITKKAEEVKKKASQRK